MIVTLIVAMTADGLIARETSQVSTAWTSKADRQFFSEYTKKAGVVVMGLTTFKTIGKPLKDRLNIIYSRGDEGKELEGKYANLRLTSLKPKDLVNKLAKEGYKEICICGGSTIYTLFMHSGLIKKLLISVEPIVFGKGLCLFKDNFKDIKLNLVNCQKLGEEGTVLLEYKTK